MRGWGWRTSIACAAGENWKQQERKEKHSRYVSSEVPKCLLGFCRAKMFLLSVQSSGQSGLNQNNQNRSFFAWSQVFAD